MVCKKSREVDFKPSEVGFLKSDSFEKTFFFFAFCRAFVYRVMNTAKVDKIERASAENEERFKIVCTDCGGNVKNKSAFCDKLEL